MISVINYLSIPLYLSFPRCPDKSLAYFLENIDRISYISRSQIELNIPVKKMLRGRILFYFLICLYIVNGQGFGLPINESTETSPTATEVTTTLEPTTTPGPLSALAKSL